MKHFFYIFIFLILLSSCKNKDFYSIEPEFQPYLNVFLEEGKKRGYEFDFDKSGLIIRFGHLEGSQIGLCHHQTPLLIEIDSTYWQSIKGKKNEKELKANLIFHELGHGVLNRHHDNSVLPSGDWKTIMCGGEKIDSRNWNVNFYSFREKYYIDELFNPQIPVPDWALEHPDFSSIKYKIVFFDDFFNNSNKWATGDKTLYKSFIAKGEYRVQTKTGKAILSISDVGIDINDDFLFEAKLSLIKTEISDAKVGVAFGKKDNSDTNYFLVDNKKKFYIGNSQYYGWFTECVSEYINPMFSNNLAIRKIDKMLYFYINGKFVYQNEIPNPEGSHFGFQLSGKSTIAIDFIKISQPVEEEKTESKFDQIILEDTIVQGKRERTIKHIADSVNTEIHIDSVDSIDNK